MNPSPIAYTSLRVDARGVLLFAQQRARLAAAGPAGEAAFLRFAEEAAPGCYSIHIHGNDVDIRPRPPSALSDGMPVRLAVSPYASAPGPFAKPASPCGYDAVRARGVATLLTSADGRELFEGCVAALVAWDGARLIAPPADRPAVRSTALGALEEAGLLSRAPLPTGGDWPLALVNALAGIALPLLPGRAPFPAAEAKRLAALFAQTSRRA